MIGYEAEKIKSEPQPLITSFYLTCHTGKKKALKFIPGVERLRTLSSSCLHCSQMKAVGEEYGALREKVLTLDMMRGICHLNNMSFVGHN